MNESLSANEVPARNNRVVFLIVAVIVGLCCFCLILGIVGYLTLFTIRKVETQTAPPFEVTVVVNPEKGIDVGDPPEGGLGNDVLKKDTWDVITSFAIGQGCDRPIQANSTIELVQEPENGVWLEKWTVVCRSGDAYVYEVEYIHDDTGVVFNIRSLSE